MKYFLLLHVICMLLFSCNGKDNSLGTVPGYMPVYASKETASLITWQAPKPIVNGGKIATIGNRLYQIETDKGIHVIDISNPADPVKLGFIKIDLCRELTLKGNYIYTNNLTDLTVIEITNNNSITERSRINNAFPDLAIQYPPCTDCYFECADPAKGVVIQWNLQQINNPKCKR